MLKVPAPQEVPPESVIPIEETVIPEVVPTLLTLDPAVTSGLFKGGCIEAA